MITSMTGYGRGESALGEKRCTVEIKATNNRYRDVNIRLPRSLQPLEDEVRSLIASGMRRGRIEVFVQLERQGEDAEQVLDVNLPLVRSYLRVFKQLGEEFGLDPNVKVEDLCQMKDVILIKAQDVDMDEARSMLQEAVRMATDACNAMRWREGRVLEEDLCKRLEHIERCIDRIRERAPLVVEGYARRLRERLNQWLQGAEVDANRLLQEVVIFADRCDITEEIVRAGSHMDQFRKAMNVDDAVGRRLDFLLQEMHREINTISSKALDADISSGAVEIKAELEKVREQIQNIE